MKTDYNEVVIVSSFSFTTFNERIINIMKTIIIAVDSKLHLSRHTVTNADIMNLQYCILYSSIMSLICTQRRCVSQERTTITFEIFMEQHYITYGT